MLIYLNPKATSINVVSQKQVGRIGRTSSQLEYVDQIVKLTMNIAANCGQNAKLRLLFE